MRRWAIMLGVLVLGVVVLAACGSDDPDRDVTAGDTLLRVTFDDAADWETGRYPAGADDPDMALVIEDGRYRIDFRAGRNAALTWGTGGDAREDVIVEVVAEQLSGSDDNLYGVGCRMVESEDGGMSGYVLLVSGDGHYGIAELSRNSLDFLLEWHQSDAINTGNAQNAIRAVCVDDYLAVYANGTFLGDVTDRRYVRPGQVALVAGVTSEGRVSVAFDDLVVSEGRLNGD